MSKRMYNSPKMETVPLHLGACIMSLSGESTSPSEQPHVTPAPGDLGAPRRRVY